MATEKKLWYVYSKTRQTRLYTRAHTRGQAFWILSKKCISAIGVFDFKERDVQEKK